MKEKNVCFCLKTAYCHINFLVKHLIDQQHYIIYIMFELKLIVISAVFLHAAERSLTLGCAQLQVGRLFLAVKSASVLAQEFQSVF